MSACVSGLTLSSTAARIVAVAACAALPLGCDQSDSPTLPTIAPATLEALTSSSGTVVSEQLEVRLAFEGPGESRLARTGSVAGKNFALHLAQSFDPESRIVTLAASIANLSPKDVWRPIRLDVVRIHPTSVSLLSADNGERRVGARWDYGQNTGPDGKLSASEVSSSRSIQIEVQGRDEAGQIEVQGRDEEGQIEVQGQDEAGLHGLRLIVKVEGTLDPPFEPTVARDPTAAEAATGLGAGMLLVRYRAGLLTPSDLAKINLRFGLIGQDYSDALGSYTAFVDDRSLEGTSRVRDLLGADPAVASASLVPLLYVVDDQSLEGTSRVRDLLGADPAVASASLVPLSCVVDGFPCSSEIEGNPANPDLHLVVGLFPEAWREDQRAGRLPGQGVLVAFLDTGVEPGGDELRDQIGTLNDGTRGLIDCLSGICLKDGEPGSDPVDRAGHGTKVASVIAAAANGIGVVGGAYGAKLVSLKVVSQLATWPQILAAGLAFVRAHPEISVVNISMASYCGGGFEACTAAQSNSLNEEITSITNQGTLIIAATGNCDRQEVAWPAVHPSVLGVAGTDNNGTRRWVDDINFGATKACGYFERLGSSYGVGVNVAAPAAGIRAVNLGGSITTSDPGTSLAAPQVAAVAAILKARNAGLDAPGLRQELVRHVVPVPEPDPNRFFFGAGRIVAALPEAGLVFTSVTSAVSSDARHTCALTAGGAAYCWGSNSHGQLGNGSTDLSTIPVLVLGRLAFASISAGGGDYSVGDVGIPHTCGITTTGVAYCWGDNSVGELGNGSTTGSTTPVRVSGELVFQSLSTGTGHTCGVTTGGTAYCWGNNFANRLGTGPTAQLCPGLGVSVPCSTVPLPVLTGFTFMSVTAGNGYSCGITTSGTVYCWGANSSGQLGNGSMSDSPIPVAVIGGLSFQAISAGDASTCGIMTGGVAYCWGDNRRGQLGDGSTTASPTPVAVFGGLVFQSIGTGTDHSCGVTMGGAGYCWGNNTAGMLGIGIGGPATCNFAPCSTVPVAVVDGLAFRVVGASALHTCGVTTNGGVYCWGQNNDGRLGNGTFVGSTVPVRVASPASGTP